MGADDEPDDAALVKAALANPDAFAALYERYIVQVYRFCYVRLGTAQQAEDAASRVFVKALEGLRSFRGGVFPAWLFRIARNDVVDTLRRQRPTQPLDVTLDWGDPAPGPEEETLARAEGETLRWALDQLTEDQRAAIELKLAGWTGAQIAEALGKSPQAVKMLRFRGLQRLRDLLQPHSVLDQEVRHGRA